MKEIDTRRFGRVFKTIALAAILAEAASCSEPTVSPDPTQTQSKTPPSTLVTESPTPTEILRAEYSATVLDLTSFVEANQDTVTQDYKDLLSYSFNLAKEMPEFLHFTPRIWTMAVSDDGPKKDESIAFAQNQTTNEFYLLWRVVDNRNTKESIEYKEPLFTEMVMGAEGKPESYRYYIKEEDGSQTEIVRYDSENKVNNSNYVYSMFDGTEVPIDGLPIYVGKTEDNSGGRLLSIVPPGENFYATLPEGSIVNTETGKITDSEGNILYHYDRGWLEWPKPESGEAMEFSPLLPAVWSKEWTGKVGDLEIPITIGLSDGVYNDKTPPITSVKGVWMTQEGADGVADAFLKAAHYRYTKLMGNEISYEDYVNLLTTQPKGGEVVLMITDNNLTLDETTVRREALIDPRQGLSLIIADQIDPKIGVKMNIQNTGFFGVDGKGRLLVASDSFAYMDLNQNAQVNGISTIGSSFLFNNYATLYYFGYMPNGCMVNGNALALCSDLKSPEVTKTWFEKLATTQVEMMNTSGLLPWGIDR